MDASTEVAVRYGAFLATILDFLIIAFAVFLMIKTINGFHDKMKKAGRGSPAEPPAPPEPSREEKLLTEIRDLLKAAEVMEVLLRKGLAASWAWTKAVPPPCCGTGSCVAGKKQGHEPDGHHGADRTWRRCTFLTAPPC